ncbi:MAG TPA: carboxypeptidase-like regulatory domain-containing protein [Planctomycetaceae bacterium]|nr:carboxypeptidase-like regulatory domain-containing protein [Planctomycetaceae bacterium]
MKSLGLIRAAAASLAAVGVLCPQLPALAQSGAPQTRVVAKADAKLAADIVMQEGQFAGRVVDHQGTPQQNREVLVKQGDKQVAKVKTDDKGVFNVKNLRPGTYTATAENTVGNFRVWNEQTAPPSAKGHALLVLGQNGARGQFGCVDPTLILLTAGVIAAVIISAITLDKVNGLEDDDDGATP